MVYVLLGGLVWLMYGRTVGWGMVVDDESMERRVKEKGLLKGIERWKYAFSFSDIRQDRLVCMGIHYVVCCLVYLSFGLMTSLLMAVHPFSMPIAVWLNGKRYGWNTIIVLLFNYHPIFAPLLLLIPRLQAGAMPAPFLYINQPLIFILSFLLVLVNLRRLVRWWKSRRKVINVEAKRWYPMRWVLLIHTLYYYLHNTLLVRHVGFYHAELDGIFEHSTVTKRWTKLSCGVIGKMVVLMGVVGIMVWQWNTGVGKGLWWWLIFSLVFSNWTSDTQSISDRYCYLPMIGLLYSVCCVLEGMGVVGIVVWGVWGLWLLERTRSSLVMYKGIREFGGWHWVEGDFCSKSVLAAIGVCRREGWWYLGCKICAEGIERLRWSKKLYLAGISLLSRFNYERAHQLMSVWEVGKLVEELDRYGKGGGYAEDSTIRGFTQC